MWERTRERRFVTMVGLQQVERHVLVVDDEEDIRDSLASLLEASIPHVRCMVAEDGPHALAAMDGRRFDLVISDYKMPGMDGVELLRRAGQEFPHVPRILITAFPDLDVAMAAINEAGIENFFTKPLDPDQILKVVEATLDARGREASRQQALARAIRIAHGGDRGA